MMQFSSEPQVAEQEMHAVIYYLTAFGYVDGEFDENERTYVKDHIRKLVEERARDMMGDEASHFDDVVARWTEHFHEVFGQIDRSIGDWYSESVGDGETSDQFVIAKLKLKCFELFKAFGEESRAALLASVDELMHADGVIHPSEHTFRNELYRLLYAPVELADDEIETVPEGGVIIDTETKLAAKQLDHAFFQRTEWDYDLDPDKFVAQASSDLDVIRRFRERLEEQRAEGQGKLIATPDFSVFAGEKPFLDGHVYVFPPEKNQAYEILVLGDLHGCYSCLKGALLQADFFGKAQAYHDDPENNPRMLLVFLGDYIDRGRFSYNGILRTVLQLYLAVPDDVFVLRGNHEYYVELNGRVLAPVRPAEAMESLKNVAHNDVFAEYMRLFEAMPNTLVFDRTLFVHAGIPRDDTFTEKVHGPGDLNDPEVRFQMLWSDPSDSDFVPLELQKANARFPFGKKQFKNFMSRLGLSTMIRGHERVTEGFRRIYDDPEATLISLFSAGGKDNADLPATSNYREVTPKALTIEHKDGVTTLRPFAIDFERYNDPQFNAFFRERLAP